jgi:hypothetical protein
MAIRVTGAYMGRAALSHSLCSSSSACCYPHIIALPRHGRRVDREQHVTAQGASSMRQLVQGPPGAALGRVGGAGAPERRAPHRRNPGLLGELCADPVLHCDGQVQPARQATVCG